MVQGGLDNYIACKRVAVQTLIWSLEKFSIKDFFGKCDQIHSLLQIWSYSLKKSLMENFIFYALYVH